ncbi:MAG TPA: non-canonical purine NTP pyrophosphatase [Bacteroidetes bacterium]|nr:non-canonical purine NTP pyrophosphatase [Bacteroidota bacterium]
MMELVFATNNKNKLREAEAILPENILLLNLNDAGCEEEIPETATTLSGNALLKARHVAQNSSFSCFADDTGLEVEALNGEPGVYSARYAGEEGNADKNMDKLLHALKGNSNRKARFVTAIALILEGKEYLFEGSVEGRISEKRRGDGGFGYDPIFIPDGFSSSFAEMSPSEKNAISHRKRALEKMCIFLEERNQKA